MSCPICQKRKAGRFCPAKAEKICAVCCGTEREVTIDCPADCAYLLSAHRYEEQHSHPLPANTPLLDVRLSSDIVHRHPQLLSGVAFTIAKFFAAQPATTDRDVLAALQGLAQSYKTLAAGIVYEQPPEPALQHGLYDSLAAFLTEAKEQPGKASSGSIKDGDIFQLLVFLFRMGLLRTNGRLRSRRFIEFLRGQFPGAQELKREESRIIVP
ncbi:MAG TPA: hypothetical protein VN792_03840 [Candidatus Acidoferrales bacterium]|nr:hypothetical protein [Candidatus Acidoferrales bacterium]HYW67741.1 hypothetical protein [Candidatus Dormibacteraeota bacterium]